MTVVWLVAAFLAGAATGLVVAFRNTHRIIARLEPHEITRLGARVKAVTSRRT